MATAIGVATFDLLDGYGGCDITLLSDGRFRTATCCDTDTHDRETMIKLRDWLNTALDDGVR